MAQSKKNNTIKTESNLNKKQNQDSQISEYIQHVHEWRSKGLIPKKLAKYWLEMTENSNAFLRKFQDLIKDKSNGIIEEQAKLLDPSILLDSKIQFQHKGGQKIVDINNFMLTNWSLLIAAQSTTGSQKKGLFNKVDLESSFGVSRKITDLMYYLQELLEGAELKHIQNNEYEVICRVNNSTEEDIVLKYELAASDSEEAKKIFNAYKRIMIGKGLKIWLAYWKIGNELHRIEYAIPMTDVMKKLADESRKTDYFSPQEKQQHWETTKMLRRTTLSIEKQYKQRGTGKTITRWLEQPLLEILGGEKDIDAMDKYPTKIAVKILKTEKSTKGFVPTIFKNETLITDHNDAYLSFVIQTKASRDRGEKEFKMEWEFLFLYGGLETTALNKKREAKAKMRAKLNRLKKDKIIEDWFEVTDGVILTPNKMLYKKYDY